MKNRWINQRNEHSCGPVALLNLEKWLGKKATYAARYNYWMEHCNCKRDGTDLSCFVESLYSIDGIKITPRSNPNIQVIDDALKAGRAVIMKSAFVLNGKLEGHYYLIAERTPKEFFCVNTLGYTGWWTKASFRSHWLQHHLYYCHECGIAPYAWIVRKAT